MSYDSYSLASTLIACSRCRLALSTPLSAAQLVLSTTPSSVVSWVVYYLAGSLLYDTFCLGFGLPTCSESLTGNRSPLPVSPGLAAKAAAKLVQSGTIGGAKSALAAVAVDESNELL